MPKLTEEQRRAVIMTAAMRIVDDSGLWAVSHGTVAKRCTVPTSAATVRRLYPTKDDMWRACIEADEGGEVSRQAKEMGWVG